MSLIRPWDFGELAALKVFHRARLFSEISNGNEKKQVEHCVDFWRRVTEANINAAGCNFNSFIRRAVRFVGETQRGLLSY